MLSRLHVREAPRNWLLDVHRDFTCDIFALHAVAPAVWCLILTCEAKSYSVDVGQPESLRNVATTAMTLAMISGAFAFVLKRLHLNDTLFEVCLMVGLCSFTMTTQYASLLPFSSEGRNRVLALSAMIWKPIPARCGLRMRYCALHAAWSFFHELMSTVLLRSLHHDDIPARFYAVLLMLHLAHLAMAVQQHEALRLRYDTERQLGDEKLASESLLAQLKQEKVSSDSLLAQLENEKEASKSLLARLKAEKEASMSLLAMVCDATLWLASDGDMITRSEHRFDAIIGCSAQNNQIIQYVPESEHARFRDVIEGDGSGCCSPVRLLTTTLSRQNGAGRVDVDLFVVDRRKTITADPILQATLGYLIGVRLSSPIGSCGEADAVNGTGTSPETGVIGDCRETETELSIHSAVMPSMPAKTSQTGPPFLPPFQVSGTYLNEQILSVLYDLVATMNFDVVGCCAWHSAQSRLADLVLRLASSHACCDEWKPPAAWQCSYCLALISSDMPREQCWLCSTERK